MKKLVLLSMATVLALGVTARVMNVEKAYQKPVADYQVAKFDARAVNNHYSITPFKMQKADYKSGAILNSNNNALFNLKAEGDATTTDSVYFGRSLGQFWSGFSTDMHSLTSTRLYSPAFYTATYKAYTNGDSWSWKYYDADDNPIDGGNAETISFDITSDWLLSPELTLNDTTFSRGYITTGGIAANSTLEFYAMNQDMDWEWGGHFPLNVNVDDASHFFSDVSEGEGLLKGIAEFVSVSPEHPFVLYSVHSYIYCGTTGGTLKLTLYKAKQDENGNYAGWTDEIITTAETNVEPNASQYQCVSFPDLLMSDPETGLDVPVVISEPFVAIISSDDAEFNPTSFLHQNIAEERHARLYIVIDDVEYLANANYTWSDNNGNNLGMNSAWNFMYDVEYNYIHGEDEEVVLAAEGGEAEIEVKSLWNTKAWTIETVDGEDVPEWLTITPEDQYTEVTDKTTGQVTQNFNGNVIITFAAEALPEGTTSREADIKFYNDGAQYIVHVKQGESGPEPDPYAPGDVNMDGNVNAGDVSAVYGVILGTETNEEIIKRADLNNDGNVNAGDISDLYAIILSASSN